MTLASAFTPNLGQLAAKGETLSLRHEAISRECYMPGVILAIKEVPRRKGLIYGLDTLLNL